VKYLRSLFLLLIPLAGLSQHTYWQQHANYVMDVVMDVESNQYTGSQKLTYTNNSPDTLDRVFYHMYFNAFQPNSEMDVRLQHVEDPDSRMYVNGKSRIADLKENEIGYLRASVMDQDGSAVDFALEGTIMVVQLAKPLLPGASTVLTMNFEGQVPLQIRRSGRNSKEGVALSMSQWYPKMVEYDHEGWHDHPYIAREFHGVWGDFDVKITIDNEYVLGGTGYLQNPGEIGHGYAELSRKDLRKQGKTLTWHFIAPKVHDFMWGADPDYLHDILPMEDGPDLHFFYKNDPEIIENWKNLQPKTAEAMEFFNANIGPYPYKQFSVVHGGDGGMEYPMSTLITGKRAFESLVGVMVHEMAHSWFYGVLANNESKHPWMDEGFTSFISSLCMNKVMQQNNDYPFRGSYESYFGNVISDNEQPQSTHSDRYENNGAYSVAAYGKGAVFLAQLGYIIGQNNLMATIKKYYQDFKFAHPAPNDFKRTAEKVSGLHLDWYLTDWTQTTNTIDYSVASVSEQEGNTKIVLERIGLMPMPIDLLVVYQDGSRESFYLPLRMMRGEKSNPYPQIKRNVLPDWSWAYPSYEFTISRPFEGIRAVVIDPSQLMADIEPQNNYWLVDQE